MTKEIESKNITEHFKEKYKDETQQKLDKWMSGQLLGVDMKEILKKANYDPTTPVIESFKMNVDQYGFLPY